MNIQEKADIRFKIDFLKNEKVLTESQAVTFRTNIVNNRLSSTIVIHVLYTLYTMITKLKKENTKLKNKLLKIENTLVEKGIVEKEVEEVKEKEIKNKKGA